MNTILVSADTKARKLDTNNMLYHLIGAIAQRGAKVAELRTGTGCWDYGDGTQSERMAMIRTDADPAQLAEDLCQECVAVLRSKHWEPALGDEPIWTVLDGELPRVYRDVTLVYPDGSTEHYGIEED